MLGNNAIPSVYLVHPDRHERDRLCALIARDGFSVQGFPSADAFLDEPTSRGQGCLVIDLEGPSAHQLLERVRETDTVTPAIMIAGGGDVSAAVRAMRAGASAFIEKPYSNSLLMREIRRFFLSGSGLPTRETHRLVE